MTKENKDYDTYYKEKFEQGTDYQDFVIKELYNQGIILISYTSKKSQYEGENMSGFEIKNDNKFRETGNLYIELAEKSHPSNPQYVPSGIYRNDNSWLLIRFSTTEPLLRLYTESNSPARVEKLLELAQRLVKI